MNPGVINIHTFRKIIQFISTILLNSYWRVFVVFGLYQGPLKIICSPVLNCYACPLAITACPIGSLQHFFTIGVFPFYTLGILALVGILVGRAACGWLCPFGLLQELLYKIPSPKLRIPQWTAKIKYLILIIFVVILPLTLGMEFGAYGKQKMTFSSDALRQVWFCKLICPAGTLEAGLPFVLFDRGVRNMLYDTSKLYEITQLIDNLASSSLAERQQSFSRLRALAGTDFGYVAVSPPHLQQQSIVKWRQWLKNNTSHFITYRGWLFAWKVFLLFGFVVSFVFIQRFFCRVFCPLGAIFGLFNFVSGWRIKVDVRRCTACDLCRPHCPVDIQPYKDYDSSQCIRCFECTACSNIKVSTIMSEAEENQ